MRKMHLSKISFGVVISAYAIAPFLLDGPRIGLILFYIGIVILFSLQLRYAEKELLIRLFHKRFCYFYKIIESILLLLPLFIALLMKKHWLLFIILFFCILLIHFLKPRSKTSILYRFTIFQPKQFEWNSGLRKVILVLLVLFTLYLYSLFYLPNMYIPFLFVYGILLLPSFFQFPQEEVSFIRVFRTSPSHFLRKKLTYNSIRLFLMGIPLLLFTWVLTPEIRWFIPVVIFVQSFIYLWICILHKYIYLGESGRFEFITGILFYSSILPFLLPFNLVYLFFSYKRAMKKLTPIL